MKKIILIILCILWMGFIFYNSSNNGDISNQRSYNILDNLRKEYRQIKENKIVSKDVNGNVQIKIQKGQVKSTYVNPTGNREEKLNLIIRKNAHAFEYFILAILVSGVLFEFNVKGAKALIYIMFVCLFYAVTDEFHQAFVPGRSSLVSDVLIDFLGSLIGIFIFYTIYYLVHKIKSRQKGSLISFK
ncbi:MULTISPECIES: VanZ family protein [Clostridium]|uniref:VanZ family protein n=1 Tax=Clostridium autoethanogenum DSM 10061 TaxID=1341692 RepID=A0ABN4BHF7_9CLOT|nr:MULTISPECIES: VanZ family protein [Clostridium]AGY76897.2 VanZ family protein [Clostridium autoethanogenum DSM 10061]